MKKAHIEVRIRCGDNYIEMWHDKHLSEHNVEVIKKFVDTIPTKSDLPEYQITGVTL